MVKLIGDIIVEERRPRTWNEPRQKRLRFVRSKSQVRDNHHANGHANHHDPNWQVATRNPRTPGAKQNEVDLWDLRKYEAQRRFHQNDVAKDWNIRQQQLQQMGFVQQQQHQQWQQHQHRLQQQHQHAQHQQQQGRIAHGQHGQQGHHQGHHQGRPQQQGQRRPNVQQHLGPSGHWSSDDSDSGGSEIVAVLSGESSSSDSDSDYYYPPRTHSRRRSSSSRRHHSSSRRPVRLIKAKPQHAKLPGVFYPKHGGKKRNKSRGRKVYYDSSSDSEDSFDRATPRRRSRSRSRGRARFVDDSSSDDEFLRRAAKLRGSSKKPYRKW